MEIKVSNRPNPRLDRLGIDKTDTAALQQSVIKIASTEPRESLTLKLTETDGERLQKYAFGTKKKHQTVIEAAVITTLDAAGA
jgi:hypothetical protein